MQLVDGEGRAGVGDVASPVSLRAYPGEHDFIDTLTALKFDILAVTSLSWLVMSPRAYR